MLILNGIGEGYLRACGYKKEERMSKFSCIQELECNITEEFTCCFECNKFKECREDGMNICGREDCPKYPKGDTEDCPYCRIEELEEELTDTKEYIVAIEEENDDLFAALIESKDTIIELQKEIIRLSREPVIWQ
jgi:hypothetical protein